MAAIHVRPEVLKGLAGKVVIITGAANGIGKTAARLFYEYGASVAIGDLDVKGGEALAADRGHFSRTDISSWASQAALFSSTFEKFGSVGCVVANAAMPEKSDFLWDDEHDDNGELKEPNLILIDVNVKGTLFSQLSSTNESISAPSAKLALHYFRKNPTPGGAFVVTGSAAGYFGGSPITKYSTSKHALLGLVRSLAILGPERGFRTNYIAPWLTATEFSSELDEIWGDRPINTQTEVAEAILTACADKSLNGRGLFVAKGIVDIELPLHQLESQWLGPKSAELWEMGRAHLQEAFRGYPTHYLDLPTPKN
ncbi:hypothetical protein FE257_009638 [Aspergillus nanangensis]|uniref:Uncharacterized protein n=1 Tax=Aspergillus nanangensis TaxID=2582783 RepID=A0AAD4CJJ5_ASPNN|nr:hypothetical protein FE257_009638 [Aspergillus nanangensis]